MPNEGDNNNDPLALPPLDPPVLHSSSFSSSFSPGARTLSFQKLLSQVLGEKRV